MQVPVWAWFPVCTMQDMVVANRRARFNMKRVTTSVPAATSLEFEKTAIDLIKFMQLQSLLVLTPRLEMKMETVLEPKVLAGVVWLSLLASCFHSKEEQCRRGRLRI
jgi:hypothetical protein